MLFAEVVRVSATVAATRSRLAKIEALSSLLRAAAPPTPTIAPTPTIIPTPDPAPATHHIRTITAFLIGVPLQGRFGTGWRTLVSLDAPPATEPGLTVAEVDRALQSLVR